jgi:hypothetical protein
VIDYVPTEAELAHIRFLRGEVCWAERALRVASDSLAAYEAEIRKPKPVVRHRRVKP